MKRLLAFVIAVPLLLAACDSNPAIDEEPEPLQTQRVTDLPADPFVGFVGGRPVGTGRYTFFCLRDNSAKTDSASTDWDIALRGTSILVNGGTSGPGQGAAQVVEGLFEEVLTAPAAGWQVDSAGGPAIPSGSGEGWYNYDHTTQTVSPIPGRVLLIKTADGRYAKVRILSYYRGSPDSPTADDAARYYNFEYVFQPDGTLQF